MDDIIEVVGNVVVGGVVEGTAFSRDVTEVDDVFANRAKLSKNVRLGITKVEVYILQLLVPLRHRACHYGSRGCCQQP